MGRDSDDALAGLEVLLDTDQLRAAFLTMRSIGSRSRKSFGDSMSL
ncbi:MAG TPA: hypothetical protein VLH56_09930 [Dissulfurispiraceae bacterium]|nr:hypothetical protein [Dissulfurispiraceae bacterium]